MGVSGGHAAYLDGVEEWPAQHISVATDTDSGVVATSPPDDGREEASGGGAAGWGMEWCQEAVWCMIAARRTKIAGGGDPGSDLRVLRSRNQPLWGRFHGNMRP